MASNSYWQLDKEYHTLSEEHDLIIRVVEHKETINAEGNEESVPNKVHEFKVKRSILINAAPYFEKLLKGEFKEAQQSTVDMNEESAESAHGLAVWLSILHGSDLKPTYRSTNLRGVWEVLAAAHKYGLDPKREAAKKWFEGWYLANMNSAHWNEDETKFDFSDYQSLLFPCYELDYAKGFAAATKYMVYNGRGHLTELRPEGFGREDLRLEQRIIQQLNAAKGRLKTILHRALYRPSKTLLEYALCEHKEKTLWAYFKGLHNTGVWPLDEVLPQKSMSEVLHTLNSFPDNVQTAELCRRKHCTFDFKHVIRRGQSDTESHFQGLCLDCMHKSKFGNRDADYWHHADFHVPWDFGCRIRHKQPTWYLSFMGRREKMIQWTKEQAAKSDQD